MRILPGVRTLVLLAAVLALAIPRVAPAVPLFFSDTVLAGFDPADPDLPAATLFGTGPEQMAAALMVTANPSPISIIQRPQSAAGMPDPTDANPYIAIIQYQITALQSLSDAILAFTLPNSEYLAGITNVGIDVTGSPIEILEFTTTNPSLFLPAFAIGDISMGSTVFLNFTMYISGPMPPNPAVEGGYELADLGFTVFGNAAVPEPGVVVLLALALLMYGATRLRAGRALGLLSVLVLVSAPDASFARDEAEVMAIRARTLSERGECEKATETMIRSGHARSGQESLLLGKCHVAARNYDVALPYLENARAVGSSKTEAELYLGIAHYHLGDLEVARANLAAARLGGVDDPQLDLYQGVLLLDAREFEAAAEAFRNARNRGEPGVEPIASFYEGVALRRAGQTENSDAAFDRVIAANPGSPWARRARDATEPVNLLGPPRRWAMMTLGGGYDSNVVLKGENVNAPSNESNSSALFAGWAGELGYELHRTGNAQAGVILGYSGAGYNSLKQFNTNTPRIGGWFDYVIDESTAVRARYDYSFMWAGHDSFASGHTIDSVLFHEWGETGRTEFEAGYYWRDYKYHVPQALDVGGGGCPAALCSPAGVNERHERNRDGHGLTVGLTHVVPVQVRNAHIKGGYRYHRYFSKGDEYKSQGHEVHMGFDTHLPAEFELDARASYTYKPFQNASTYPDPEQVFAFVPYALSGESRRDDVVRVDLSIGRKISDRSKLEARYMLVRNGSNTDVFDYNRQVFGLFLTTRFQP